MKLKTIINFLLILVFLLQPFRSFSFETDQYTLPPEPLADIGDEVSNYVQQNIRRAIDKLNAEILTRRRCLENEIKEKKCRSDEQEKTRLEFLRSEKAVAREVYNLLGTGIPPFTSSGSWLESNRFKGEPARFKTSLRKSIYLTFPINYIGIASTVNVYGAHFGTDKIAHFFQQGYGYYQIYKESLEKGETPDAAAQKAIRWGRKTERTYYGTLLTGVYSNADLCANYAGMKFYLNLTNEIKIKADNNVKPAVLILKNGSWAFNENSGELRETLLKPFVSAHFNEALNPSIVTRHFGLRAFVRRIVRKRNCPQWLKQFPEMTRADFQSLTGSLTSWHGDDYGFTPSENFITIADTCFGTEKISTDDAGAE